MPFDKKDQKKKKQKSKKMNTKIDRPKPKILGKGMARKAAEAAKKRRKRLDEILKQLD